MKNRIISRRTFVAASAAALGAIALPGCAGGTQQGASSTGGTDVQASSVAADSTGSSSEVATSATQAAPQADSSAAANAQAAPEASGDQATSEASDTSASTETATTATGTKVAVACFSATGNTRAIAQHLVAHLGADYIEIEPAEPYTEADLDYGDETTRATAEQNDPATRPALAAMPDFSTYDVVYLGHPIWWSKAPRLICTLLEGCDLTGKKMAEFCTSGSSGIEGATGELTGLAPGAEWVDARRFAAGTAETEVANWADSLGIA